MATLEEIKKGKGDATPYERYTSDKADIGWIYGDKTVDKEEYAVIKKARFKSAGYQGYIFGLVLDYDIENGSGGGWEFCSMRDITVFLTEMKVDDITELVGKTILAFGHTPNLVAGIGINRRMIINTRR